MNLTNSETKKILCLALAIAAKWFCSKQHLNLDGYNDEKIIDVAYNFYTWIESTQW